MFHYTLKGLTVLDEPYFQFWLIFLTGRKACKARAVQQGPELGRAWCLKLGNQEI